MSFTHPSFLFVGIAVALAFFFLYRAIESRRTAAALTYSNLEFLVASVRSPAWPRRVFASAWIAAVLLIVLGIAGPRVRAYVPVRGSVMLCVDTSGSMAATDVEPSRAGAADTALRAFLAATPSGTAVGIIAFASGADVVVPPTRDRDEQQTGLGAIPGPNGGTAIGDALLLARRTLPPSGHRVVVLITDGVNNQGSDPLQAAQDLGRRGIRLYTVGIGTNSGALIPGTLDTAGIDEDALRAYAAATGGAYSRADDATQLREALARLGRTATFERAGVDLSLPAALAGAAIMLTTFLVGFAAGRYP